MTRWCVQSEQREFPCRRRLPTFAGYTWKVQRFICGVPEARSMPALPPRNSTLLKASRVFFRSPISILMINLYTNGVFAGTFIRGENCRVVVRVCTPLMGGLVSACCGAGVARRQPSFFASPKKERKERRPQVRRPSGSLRYSERQAAAELGLVVAMVQRVIVCARPQTVLADFPCRSCVARLLSWGPWSQRDDRTIKEGMSSRRRPGSKLINVKLGPGLNPGRQW